MPYSFRRTNKDVRRFLRENGVAPTMSNVERIGGAIRRTQGENERAARIAKESGRGGTFDGRGRDMHRVVKGIVKRDLDRRGSRPG